MINATIIKITLSFVNIFIMVRYYLVIPIAINTDILIIHIVNTDNKVCYSSNDVNLLFSRHIVKPDLASQITS